MARNATRRHARAEAKTTAWQDGPPIAPELLPLANPPPPVGTCNRTVSFVVAALAHAGKQNFWQNYSKVVPTRVVRAVDGYNHTETIEALLDYGIPFHRMSNGPGRRWGKVATFLTKYRVLSYQVQNKIPYQLSMEDDLVLRGGFRRFVGDACASFEQQPQPDLLKLSRYSELFITSLSGAARILKLMRLFGMRRNDDQQLGDPRIMGDGFRMREFTKVSDKHARAEVYALGKGTNAMSAGSIGRTRKVTWAEVALLRLISTGGPSSYARKLPRFGGPDGSDVKAD